MKRVSALILLFQLGVCFAANSIIAIVNEDVITLQSIEQQLNDANSFNEKIDIVEKQIEIALQMSKVRKLGLRLSLPKAILLRHPFPGPGLAIRIPGKITKEKIDILKEADFIFINELKKSNLYNKIWQAYAALLPLKTVGVMGDSRTYEYTCLLRAVTSEDGMTANFFSFDKDFVQKISNKIINSVNGINRVVYDITSKPPSTIELE